MKRLTLVPMSVFALCILTVLISINTLTQAQILELDEIGEVPGGDSFADQELFTADGSFTYLLYNHQATIWSDGRADFVLERNILNESINDFTSLTHYFAVSPDGDYTVIRAWDADGPLQVSTESSGNTLYVTVHFRYPLPIGESYQFSLALTIGGVIAINDDIGRVYWTTIPAYPVQEFVRRVSLPSNATILTVAPPPTTQHNNDLEWREYNTPVNWQHRIDVWFNLSETIQVPLFLQHNTVLPSPHAPWSADVYGNYPDNDPVNTIARWGCVTTSAAMLLSYWAEYNGSSDQTDPRILNNWLRTRGGYNEDHGVIPCAVYRYSVSDGRTTTLYVRGRYDGQNDQVIDEYLTSGRPVIIGVDVRYNEEVNQVIPHHWVVATGKTTINGQDTYLINDPVYGSTTLFEQYNNIYQGIRLYSNTLADTRNICITAHSPVELVITDPLGRKTGYDPNLNTSYDEIPGGSYMLEAIVADGDPSGDETLIWKSFLLHPAFDGEYHITVYGFGDGDYTIDARASAWSGDVTRLLFSGQAEAGSVDTYTIRFDSDNGIGHHIFLPYVERQ